MYDAASVSRGSRKSALRVCFIAVFLFALFGIEAGQAQTLATAPDTILFNGKIVVHDGSPAQALTVRNGRIAAIGDSSSIRALANASTRVIDLGGRTVIPGLIDSHIHAIRAGLSYNTEVHWFGVRTLQEGLDRIRAAAKTTPKGSWLVVAGGWTDRQFREGRRPTQAEITAAAPDHHVYIQLLYTHVLLGPGGADVLGISDKAGNAEWSERLAIERDKNGKPTGWLAGDNRAISDLFNLLPRPTVEQKLAGTRAFFRALNAMGITGVSDPGGYNLEIDDYQPLFQLWREHGLTLRVRYSLSAPRRDRELEDFKALTQMRSMGFGDDWLRFNGIGENVTWGHYNTDNPNDAQKEQLTAVLPENLVRYILLARVYGLTLSAELPSGADPSAAPYASSMVAAFPIASTADLINSSIQVSSATGPIVVQSPLQSSGPEFATLAAGLFDLTTVNSESVIYGRVNLQTAPEIVLRMIPGLTPELVTQIITQRATLEDAETGTVAWLLSRNVLDPALFRRVFPELTMGGDVFQCDVLVHRAIGGPMLRRNLILDAASTPPRRLYWAELTDSPLPYSQELLLPRVR